MTDADFCRNDSVRIRAMRAGDAKTFCDAEIAQGWHQTEEKYLTRVRDRDAGKCVSLVAEYAGTAAGYVSVYFAAGRGAFGGRGYCEIVDLGVLKRFRRRGIGQKLMDAAEEIAFGRADTVYLGVGLHAGYGSAQRLYAKRGYLPDGSGVWYQDTVLTPYARCENDDDLVLYLSKTRR